MNDKRRHIMMLVEADASAGVSTDDFSKSLEFSVAEKQKFLQSKSESFQKSKKQLEDLLADNKMHLDQLENSIRVSKSNPDEVRQLTMEKSKLQKQQVELKNQMTELEKQRQQAIKDAEEEIKHAREMKAKLDAFNVQQAKMAKDSEAQQAKVQKEMHDPERKELMIRRNFARMEEQDEAPTAPKKSVLVNFDKSTDQPFQVKFTERGFLIGDTRLSFEILEVAVSKEFNITLNNGTGLVLDAVRMQKILKYKDRV
jgi:chromosome segregation ATPase